MSATIPVAIGIVIVALLLGVRRPRKAADIISPLSIEDRQFIADQIEPITKLPLTTAEDEDAWYAATRSMMERLKTRFPEVALVVPHQLYHYIDDADIHRKKPSYRAAQERYILEFIQALREQPQKT